MSCRFQFAQFTAAQEKSQSQEVGKKQAGNGFQKAPRGAAEPRPGCGLETLQVRWPELGCCSKPKKQKELTSKQWCIVESLLQSLEQVEVEFESLVWKDFLCKLWQNS